MKYFANFLLMCAVLLAPTTLTSTYHSQFKQDEYLNTHIFKNKKNGIFIDIGAHDGMSLSNTYFFEKELGWSGICIEPYPEFFQKLSQNRASICLPVCAGKENGAAQFLKIKSRRFDTEMLSGMVHCYNNAHLARIKSEVEATQGSLEIISVPVRTLTDIFLEHGIYHVDFISLDVEGGELDVLLGLDFSKFHIKYILIENNYPYSFGEIHKILTRNGYKIISHFDIDELYELQENK